MGLICKQPNGNYCRISTVTDTPTHVDMSVADLKRYLLDTNQLDYERQSAEDWYGFYGKQFQMGLQACNNRNMSWEEFEDFLDETGYNGNRDQYWEQFADELITNY